MVVCDDDDVWWMVEEKPWRWAIAGEIARSHILLYIPTRHGNNRLLYVRMSWFVLLIAQQIDRPIFSIGETTSDEHEHQTPTLTDTSDNSSDASTSRITP